ncbi:hypothetical protein P700755_000326 [Psychroflexus torquis ATCC 700755]|uniref:Uncharacterized protein n=1 Tax=Psychroflexus torquis (strain ATCC 700755 / CIP 106069 / ACAM 623) TaxID=313595 RepID=K4I9Q9_PSYTT|nr:hypothetical protein [Psychroflexus torquis]AFU67362.1 hypothetical protein P700755_000326 [Psychroflexus torquis ATCC 700755]
MISLNKNTIEILKLVLGSCIIEVSSPGIKVNIKGDMNSLKMAFNFKLKDCILKNVAMVCDYKIGFYDLESGNVIYDYDILKNHVDYKESIPINCGPINKIMVFGRIISGDDKKELITFNKKLFNGKIETNDVFLFQSITDDHLLIVFDNFLPSFTIHHSKASIDLF